MINILNDFGPVVIEKFMESPNNFTREILYFRFFFQYHVHIDATL